MSSTESTQPAVSRPAAPAQTETDRTAAAIEAELRVTRERLAATVDAIVDRAHPQVIADRGKSRLKGLVIDEDGRPRMERIATVAGGVAGAVVALLVLRRLVRGKQKS